MKFSFLEIFPDKKLIPLFISSTLRRASFSLLGIFSPIYIFKIGQDLNFSLKISLFLVISFFFLLYLVKIFSLPLAENLAFSYGFKKICYFSVISFFLFSLFLFLGQKTLFYLFLASFFWGVSASLFWFSYHGLFLKLGDRNHFGLMTAEAQFLEVLVNFLFPLLGGFLIWKVNFGAFLILVGLVFILSLISLSFSSEAKPLRDAQFKKVWQLFKTHQRMALSYLGLGAENGLYGIFWPLFLFFTLGEVFKVGKIFSFAILFAGFFILVVGIWVDKIGKRSVIRFGSPLAFFSWIGRFFSRFPEAMVGIDAIYRLVDQMLVVPLLVWTYQKALEGGTGQALYFREILVSLGAIFALFFGGIVILLNGRIDFLFFLGALFSLFPLLVVIKKK
jgi:MFS family permease